jgi:hypothetical protein
MAVLGGWAAQHALLHAPECQSANPVCSCSCCTPHHPRDAASGVQLPRQNLSGRKGQAVGLLLKKAGARLLQVGVCAPSIPFRQTVGHTA